MADFEKGKIRERNRKRSQILGEKNGRWPSLQADLIGMERDEKVIGKLDLFYLLPEIEKLR